MKFYKIFLVIFCLFFVSIGAVFSIESNKSVFQSSQVIKPLYHGDKFRKQIALTIDDGQKCDYRILELLASYNIKCTVFITGDIANKDTRLMKQLIKQDFEICNHTYSHRHMKKMTNLMIKKDIINGQNGITRRTGKKLVYLRPPYGEYDSRINKITSALGYRLVLWNLSFCDTAPGKPDAVKQLKWVEAKVKNGSIILCHFGGKNTYKIMKQFIPDMLNKGYKFCTVSELLKV